MRHAASSLSTGGRRRVRRRAHNGGRAPGIVPAVSRALVTSWTLIRGAASGDPSDRELFARFYRPVIATYLAARWRKPVDHPDVQDGIQEVFVQCLRPGGALERVESNRPEKFRSFLYGVTRHVAATIERHGRRESIPVHEPRPFDEIARRDSTLSRVFDRAWATMIAREARVLMANRLSSSERANRSAHPGAALPRGHAGTRDRGAHADRGRGRLPGAAAREADFRTALLDVMRRRHPTSSVGDLERRCRELTKLL